MHAEQISDLFRVQERFRRSAHLEKDFADPKALKGYILTPQATTYLEQLAGGLDDNSGQRAWRITGDYGSGKSSFALLLAHLFGAQRAHLPSPTPCLRSRLTMHERSSATVVMGYSNHENALD